MLQWLGFGGGVGIYGLLMIGSLLGSTDPVAVNALLKELGTPVRLNMILEGESLLNDGVSLVLAFAFKKFYESDPLTPFQIAWNVISLCIGGPLFGLIVGFIFYSWMIRIMKDQVMMVTITFICCFLVFFSCEYPPWNLSGILAIVMASLFLSYQGKMKMVADDMYSVVEAVWHFVQFIGESLLFVITGIFVGRQLYANVTSTHGGDFLWDIFRVAIFFICMNIIRWLMIMLFVPFINHKQNASEYKIGVKDAIVIAYSGIRGAFPLIICLTILQNETYSDRFKYVTSVVTVGVIFLGIIFNGLTIKMLIQSLKIIQPNYAANSLKKKITGKIWSEYDESYQSIKNKDQLFGANWRIVERLCGVEINETEGMRRMNTYAASVSMNRPFDSFIASNKKEVEGEIRLRLLYYFKSEVLRGVKNGECGSEAGSIIIYACEYAEESALDSLEVWRNLESIIQGDWVTWIMERYGSSHWVSRYLESYYVIRKSSHFECVYYFLRLLEKSMKTKETIVPVGSQALRFLDIEMSRTKESVEEYISTMNNTDPGLFRLYQTKRAAKDVIFQRIAVLRSFYKEGLLSKEVG